MQQAIPRQPARPKRVRCKCRSHCTLFNPITRQYEGDGQLVSRSTRDNHARDDKDLPGRAPLQTSMSVLDPVAENWIDLVHTEIDALKTMVVADPDRPLLFHNNPNDHGAFRWPTEQDILMPNFGTHALTRQSVNRDFLFVENRFCELASIILNRNTPNEQTESLMNRLHDELGVLTRQKEVQWAQQRSNSGTGKPFYNTEIHFRPIGSTQTPVVRTATVLSLVMECIYFMPRRAVRVLLGGFKSFLRAAGATPDIVESVPVDPRPGHIRFHLDPTTRQFIVCTSCHFLYPFLPGDNPINDEMPFIMNCSHHRTPESPVCGTPLWKNRDLGGGRTQLAPIRKYLHQTLKSWLGRLLSRKGIENLLDNPLTNSDPFDPQNPVVDDIWRSRTFQELRDAFGNPFFPGPGKEGRLVFSLSVDGFNPFHNKTAKQTASSTGIWLVLLNLPQHLRYLTENMYLAGVIPDKPSKEEIYSYLELVVNELLEFWNDGVTFSRTYKEPLGRLFKAMLIPVVCDMLAARQVTGLGSPTAHSFCSFCDLDIDDIDVLDRSEWPVKDLTNIRRIAELWRDAPSEQRRVAIFDAYGIRWSPLYDLPYWNVIKYTVIDPMHALDLNSLLNHCRSLFQIDTTVLGGDGLLTSSPNTNHRHITSELVKAHEKCVELIRRNNTNLLDELLDHPRFVIYKICVDNSIKAPNHTLVVGTKWVLARNIVAWRRNPEYNNVVLVPMSKTIQKDQPNFNRAEVPQVQALPPDLNLDMARVLRVIRYLVEVDDQEESRAKAYTQATAAVFIYICDLLEIEHEDIDKAKRNAKRQLFLRLVDLIDDDLSAVEMLKSFLLDSSPTQNRPVLGKDVMAAVWSDMTRTILPTWITPAPPNWGTAERGKLSADNWRVICTIHLPITLIRLWSEDTPRKQELLAHFMDLVAAVRIANMRISSPNQIREYNEYISRYVGNIRRLYPDQHLKPIHHASLHIGDMLELFGPNHSHSGPHYERYINFFHRINTNSKLGQLESTFLKASARSANLRALLSEEDDLRHSLEELITVMNSVEFEDIRGFRLASILDPHSPTFTPRSELKVSFLPADHHQMLCELLGRGADAQNMPRSATLYNEISFRGVCYGTSNSSTYRNSSVIFKEPNNTPQLLRAGMIDQIFRYTYFVPDGQQKEDIFITLRELVPIDHEIDPYRRFGAFGGFLCEKTNSRLRIISIFQLVSHFALTDMAGNGDENVIHAMPVDRLMLDFNADFANNISHTAISDAG